MPVPADRSGTRLGSYRIDSLLGRGGMGEVYRAFDMRRERNVALKLLPPELSRQAEYRDRFDREARSASRLEHPHIVPIHDWGRIDDTLFLDMRLVQGRTLGDLLRSGPIDPTRALAIAEQIASALDAAHAIGLVHRDVKPDNILIGDGDFSYLLDFGIAHTSDDTRLTRTGTVVGSVAYMAPERFGEEPVNGAIDEYALCCVLFESLFGRPPFPGADLPTAMRGHLFDPVPRTDTALDPVFAIGLAKTPRDRFPTCTALVAAARSAHAGPTTATPIPPPPPRPIPQAAFAPTGLRQATLPASAPRSSSGTLRRRLLGAAGVVLLLGVVAGGAGYLMSTRDGDSNGGSNGSPTAVGASVGADHAGPAAECHYLPAATSSSKIVDPPSSSQPRSGTAVLHLQTSQGSITVDLDRAGAPCNTGAIETLAQAGFYDHQGCARLSDYILVCRAGGSGAASEDIQAPFDGPGWTSPNELPQSLPPAVGKVDTLGRQQVVYPKGSVLVTNPGAQAALNVANGSSSFFFVIKPIITAPLYTSIGTVSSGMAMLESVVRAGFVPDRPGANFGMPQIMPNILEATVSTD